MSRPRVVHLGLGSFHRAHQAVYTAEAGGWAITGVAIRSRGIVSALRAQDHRYTVLTLGDDGVRVQPVDVIDETLVAVDDPAAVTNRIADPATRVVTLTVTEAGYAMRTGTPDLDLDAVAGDVADPTRPRTAIGLLARGLSQRAAGGAEPIAVVSCDNLTANGPTLRRLLTQFAVASGQPVLLEYLDTLVDLPATMVDRIVPATTDEHLALARNAGYRDAVPVPAEPFHQWVVEPRFRAGRPEWERAGAELSTDVAGYETVKVRLLNGTHSLIGYLGLLAGQRYMADAFADESVQVAVDALATEYLPTLDVPPGLDLPAYLVALSRRFGNRALAHRTAQVGTDGSLKLVQRIAPAALWHLERTSVPTALALVVAAYLSCFGWPTSVPTTAGDRPTDPAADWLRALSRRYPDPVRFAHAALGEQALLGPAIAGYLDFAQRVGEQLAALLRGGVPAAVGELVSC